MPDCGQNRSPMAFVARLRSGESVAVLDDLNLQITNLANEKIGSQARVRDIVVIGITRRDGSAVSLASFNQSPSLEAVGTLYAQSARADLLSCDYQLADSPGAVVVRNRARDSLVGGGLATAKVLDSDTTIWTIIDDPFTGGLIVSAQVRGARTNPVSEEDALYGLDRLVVVLDASGSVVTSGRADW